MNITLISVIAVAIFLWLIFLTLLILRVIRHYNKLTEGTNQKNLGAVLEKIIENSDKNSKRIDNLTKLMQKLETKNVYNFQKIGLVRFNPFQNMGGNQSFCLALLDGEDSGLVISSLHSRENTRIYAKLLQKGKPVGYQLSTEEIQAVKNAKKIR